MKNDNVFFGRVGEPGRGSKGCPCHKVPAAQAGRVAARRCPPSASLGCVAANQPRAVELMAQDGWFFKNAKLRNKAKLKMRKSPDITDVKWCFGGEKTKPKKPFKSQIKPLLEAKKPNWRSIKPDNAKMNSGVAWVADGRPYRLYSRTRTIMRGSGLRTPHKDAMAGRAGGGKVWHIQLTN